MSQKVKVIIAGRIYPLSVREDEEGVLRKAVERIEKFVKEFGKKYQITDKQDALAMTALQIASEMETLGITNNEEKEKMLDRLDEIIQLLPYEQG